MGAAPRRAGLSAPSRAPSPSTPRTASVRSTTSSRPRQSRCSPALPTRSATWARRTCAATTSRCSSSPESTPRCSARAAGPRRTCGATCVANARRTVADLKRAGRRPGEIEPGDETTWKNAFEKPEDILIVCAGGRAGSWSACLPGWGNKWTRSVTTLIERPVMESSLMKLFDPTASPVARTVVLAPAASPARRTPGRARREHQVQLGRAAARDWASASPATTNDRGADGQEALAQPRGDRGGRARPSPASATSSCPVSGTEGRAARAVCSTRSCSKRRGFPESPWSPSRSARPGAAMAATWGLLGFRFLDTPHPIATLGRGDLEKRAEALAPLVIGLLRP